ncbi:MAG: outer membrane protein assembly factor BamD [Gammaproteobacteria bacterium]|nr:MAG: outer membrane protein assembly factor BamD [Gammaproteobacteria bacterium]
MGLFGYDSPLPGLRVKAMSILSSSGQLSGGLRALFLAALAAILLAGCGSNPDRKQVPASDMYQSANRAMKQGQWQKAADRYNDLIQRYPFGHYTAQAQLELAYAQYKNQQPEFAILAANRFIKIYPTHQNVDYAYYIKGLANYDRDKGLLDSLVPHSVREHDQHNARQAFLDFSELAEKYPYSKYADDARERMEYLRDNLALYELGIAEFYLKRTAYVAAINRAEYVVENYQQTPSVSEALVVMIKGYRALGLEQLEQDVTRVLALNFPDHPFLRPEDQSEGFWGSIF